MSTTRTTTITETHARHVASKVATDLKRLQRIFSRNQPSDDYIDNFEREVLVFLKYGYLGEVIYGFKRNDKWVVALRYIPKNGELSGSGDDPGGIKPETDISGAYFSSWLTFSDSWDKASQDDKNSFETFLPFKRTFGHPSGVENGCWVEDRSYISGDIGVQRAMIRRQ